jgi:uncharacterized protein YdaU (DUF1376 family)
MPMSKDSNIFYPMYANEFISHTTHLSNTSLGCYIKLLNICFLQKDCHLQVRNLHKICGYSNGKKWETIWKNDLEELFIYNNDKTKVTNKRLYEEFNKIQDLRIRRQASSKVANRVRWKKHKKGVLRNGIRNGSSSDPYIELDTESIYIDKYSNLTVEERKEKKRLKDNADMLNNNI